MKNAYELAETILKSRPDKNRELKSSDSFASIELYGTSACKKVQDTGILNRLCVLQVLDF